MGLRGHYGRRSEGRSAGLRSVHVPRRQDRGEGLVAQEPHRRMTDSTTACACHGPLGIAPTIVSDDVLEKIKGVSIPTISGILRRLGHRNTFLAGLVPRTPIQ